MKALTYCLFFLALLFTSACSKELSLENAGIIEPPPPGEQMQWQFEDSLGIKQGDVDTAFIAEQGSLQALFIDGTSDDGEYRILLNVVAASLRPGSYRAENVNFTFYQGADLIYFNDPSVGEFTLNISAIDTARVTGTFSGVIVDVRTGITSIQNGSFSADLNSMPAEGTSEGTLVCDTIGVFGDYLEGEETNATHYIEFDLNVTKPGTFVISTDEVNGISYAAEGEFAEPGLYTIQLGAFGVPVQTGPTEFTLTYAGSSCNFTVEVKSNDDSLVEAPGGLLSAEEKTFGALLRDDLWYRTSNNKIAEIRSNGNPLRKLFYDGADRLNTQEFWVSDGFGGTYKDRTFEYSYDGAGNVIAITNVDDNGEVIDTAFSYTIAANKVSSKTIYSNGAPVARALYTYTNDNLTMISYTDQSLVNVVDSIVISYDTRDNKFNSIHSQYYFIDMANVFEDTHQNEMFFFSKNYPVSMTLSNGAVVPIAVQVNPSFQPTEVSIDGQSWFKYYY